MTTGYQQPRPAQRSSGPARKDSGRADSGRSRRVDAVVDLAETELAELYELPGGELPPDEAAVEILAEQADEFTCGSCFLVRHRSQMAREKNGIKYCRDCEG